MRAVFALLLLSLAVSQARNLREAEEGPSVDEESLEERIRTLEDLVLGYKFKLEYLEKEFDEFEDDIKTELTALEGDFKAEITTLEGDFKAEFTALEVDIKEDFDDKILVTSEDLKADLEILSEKVKSEGKSLEETQNMLQEMKSETNQLQDVQVGLKDNINRIETRTETVESNMAKFHSEDLSALNVPLGTIVPWIPRPDKDDETYLVEPSDNWVRCDGRGITVGPWKGHNTPNLVNLFVRAGTDANYLHRESDALQNHKHVDPGHRHYDQGHTHRTQDCRFHHGEGSWKVDEYDGADKNHLSCPWVTSKTGYANLKTAGTGVSWINKDTARISHETRPANMRLIYIMKVA